MTGYRLLAFAFFILAAVSGCSDDKGGQSQSAPQGQTQNGQQAMPVGVLEVAPETINYSQKLPGRVVSYRVAEIRPQVSGIIQERLFEEGTLVEEGQQLYQIDPERYEADLDVARANLESAHASAMNAQTLVDRYDGLAEMKALSQQDFDNAKTELKMAQASVSQAEAEVKTAEINLAFTKMYAPISGFIGPSAVTKGALVTQQQATPLAVIRQMDPVYVDLSQSVSDAQQLKARLIESSIQQNDDSEFEVNLFFTESGEPYPHKGKLDATDLAVDEQTGAIRLRSVFPNPDNRLLPGTFVRASIKGMNSSQALVVPQKSVQISDGGATHVWVVQNGNKAAKRTIQTGVAYQDKWVVASGLEVGDNVIVEGTMNLKDGMPVKPRNVNSSGKEASSQKDKNTPSSTNSGQ